MFLGPANGPASAPNHEKIFLTGFQKGLSPGDRNIREERGGFTRFVVCFWRTKNRNGASCGQSCRQNTPGAPCLNGMQAGITQDIEENNVLGKPKASEEFRWIPGWEP
jgi:hypothetical protein